GQRGGDEHGLLEHQSVEHPLGDDPDSLRHQRGDDAAAGVRSPPARRDPSHHPAELPRLSASTQSAVEAARGGDPIHFLVRAIRRSLVARTDDLCVSWLVHRGVGSHGREQVGPGRLARLARHTRAALRLMERSLLTRSGIRLSRRVSEMRISPTLAVMNKAHDLIARGVDVVDLGPGEPDFPTPQSVAEAGKRAIDRGFTKYTANSGTKALRDAIAARYNRRWGTEVTADNVI